MNNEEIYSLNRKLNEFEENYIQALEENQELKKQLEEINDFINKANFANIEQLMLDYCAKTEEQREFIDWLENEKKEQFIQHRTCHQSYQLFIEKIIETETMILEKYKEIIGGKENEL